MPLRREGVQRVLVLICSLESHSTGEQEASYANGRLRCYDSYSNMICPKDLPSATKDAVKTGLATVRTAAATVLQPQSMSGEEESIV